MLSELSSLLYTVMQHNYRIRYTLTEKEALYRGSFSIRERLEIGQKYRFIEKKFSETFRNKKKLFDFNLLFSFKKQEREKERENCN